MQSEMRHEMRLSSQCKLVVVGLRQAACIEPKLAKHAYSQDRGGSVGTPKLVFSCVVQSELRESHALCVTMLMYTLGLGKVPARPDFGGGAAIPPL